MKKADRIERTCPKCGRKYKGIPAVSRMDNNMLICPECGTREALESMGISKEEQDRIIRTINEQKGE